MMNKLVHIAMVGLLAGALLLLASGPAAAQVSGTKHDMSLAPYSIALSFVCQPCHTPHAWAGTGAIPMANRNPTAQATFTNYTSTTLTVTPANPSGSDLVCLGCHDGTLAVDAFGGAAGTVGKNLATLGVLPLVGVAGNLANAHPIGFAYTTPPTGYTNPGYPLNGGKVGCATCHDPHNATAGEQPFLRASGAALCSSCHPQ